MIRSFSLALESFILDKKAQNKSPHTIAGYEYHLKRFMKWLDINSPRTLSELEPLIIRSYLVSMRDDGLSDSSVKSAHRHLKAFFRFCEEEGFIEESPMARIRTPAVDHKDKPVLSHEDIRKLLRACRTSRDAAIVSCLIDTGCRASEFVRWTVDDVDMSTGSVTVIGKSRRERVVFIGHRARRYLIKWMSDAEIESGPLWLYQGDNEAYFGKPLKVNGLRQMLHRLGARAGVDNCNPHAFRRTFAVECLKNGMDIFTLQRLMGHKSLDMLKHYLTLVTADLEDAHRSYAPMDRI